MYRLLILLFGIVSTVSVTALLVLLYHYADKESIQRGEGSGESPGSERLFRPEPEAGWLKKLAKKRKPDFSYAVTELEIELPLLQQSSVKKKPKPFVIRNMDEYKMFCLRQVLETEGCRFVLYRKKNSGILILHSEDKRKLQKIMGQLREFEISMQKDK